jgi:hypothetical protein
MERSCVQSVERESCQWLLASSASAQGIKPVIVDAEPGSVSGLTEGTVETLLNRRRQREIGDVTATRADDVVVMFCDVFCQLIASEFVMGDDASHGTRFFENVEVSVDT